MSNGHGNDEYNKYAHNDAHEDGDGYGEDNDLSHHDNDGNYLHDGYDEDDDGEEDDHGYDETDEEKDFIKLNDLYFVPNDEHRNLDISVIQKPLPLEPYQSLFKKNTLDISLKELQKINLTLTPRIKILEIKKPISDIVFTKKRSDISLRTPQNKKLDFVLDIVDIQNTSNFLGPYSDFIHPSKTFKKLISGFFGKIKGIKIHNIFYISNTKKNIDDKKYILSFYSNFNFFKKTKNIAIIFGIFCFLFGYGMFTKTYVQKSFTDIQKIKISPDINILQKQLLDLKTSFIISDILLKPVFLGNIVFGNKNIENLEYATLGVSSGINYSINIFTIYQGIYNLMGEKGPHEIFFSELYKNILPILSDANSNLDRSIEYFSGIKNLPNPQLETALNQKLTLLHKVSDYFHLLYDKKEAILEFLGDNRKKTYMIVFQNADEIRPTGGFMGSLAFIQIYKGKILNFEKKDIYALEWYIKDTFNELPPPGLSSITKNFTLRDANFYPDIKESSEKIKSFVDKTQYHIDGIVYINQNIIIDFLKTFGGVYYDTMKREVTWDNFSMLMSTLVESKVSKTHTLATPKQVLFDFIDLYMVHLKELGKYSLYIKTLFNSFEKKDILIYSFDKKVNDLFQDFGMKEIKFDTYFDFNYPVFTSISGNKSDRYIQREFQKNITQNTDCSYLIDLNVKQYHNFGITQEVEIKNFLYDVDLLGRIDLENTLYIQGKGPNKQFVRILLPKKSIIKESKKIQIKEFDTYKEVSFYTETQPGSSSETKISYILENTECKPYTFDFLKQPGIPEYKLSVIKNNAEIFDSFLSKDYILK